MFGKMRMASGSLSAGIWLDYKKPVSVQAGCWQPGLAQRMRNLMPTNAKTVLLCSQMTTNCLDLIIVEDDETMKYIVQADSRIQ